MRLPLVFVALMGVSVAALAQHAGHHGSHGAANAGEAASTTAYKKANEAMHRGMDIKFSGDADLDFIRGMIPHHQGAVEMAKIVLAHGKDAELKKLASEIIAAQDKEIAFMREWLKKKGQ